MSARGWAGVLNEVAREIEIAVDVESGRIQYGAPVFERPDVARLRELAALLDRAGETHPLTDLAEAVEDAARFTDEYLLSAEEVALGSDTSTSRVARQAATLLRSLARGPAEQQETGR